MSRYGDSHIRKMLSATMLALLNEYERCTKRTTTLDYSRLAALTTLELRGITVDDIFTVVRYVKRLIRTGENKKRVGTFTLASLEFGNMFTDYSKFEDRLQTAREELIAKRIRKNKLVAVATQVSEADTITRLLPDTSQHAPDSMKTLTAAALRSIADSLI